MKNDPRWQTALYTTETYNEEGLEGHAYVPDGLNLQTSKMTTLEQIRNNYWGCHYAPV
ncbi:hypothetical protein IV43_GL001466 [Ligilactobacillus acidipiscis]|uniref:Uncharacterized protein n=1 Tax=Ligilactobacillus acidipiscis TaxID=89059 RepID=A0A0R2K1M6_9LACO|nr:hypothetical protein IV43_GL001466 [Ligilactobacillus acidipiscis]